MLIIPKLTLALFFPFSLFSGQQQEQGYVIYAICFVLFVVSGLLLKKYIKDKARWLKELELERLKNKAIESAYEQKMQRILASRDAESEAIQGLEIIPESTELPQHKEKKFFDTLISLILDRISDPQLSVEELGKAIGLSRSSLYKKLKSRTGYVPNEFIRVIRLKHAAELLRSNEYNVSEISYMVGFNSHSYFSKCFVQQFNLTPTEFVESYRQEEMLSPA